MEEDYTIATKLQQSIAKAGIYCGTVNRKRWAEEYRQLREKVGSDRAKRVVEQYSNFLNKNGRPSRGGKVPVVTSMKKLRCSDGLFEWVEESMEKNLTVKISKEAKSIHSWVEHLYWPKGSKEDLLKVIQISYDRSVSFFSKVRSLHGKTKNQWLKSRLDRILDEHYSTSNFITKWIKKVNDQVIRWEDWNGNLMMFAFRVDHDMFTKIGRNWMQEYSGNPKDWDKLLRKLT